MRWWNGYEARTAGSHAPFIRRGCGDGGRRIGEPTGSCERRGSLMRFPWQEASWAQLDALRERWPHALLIHGPAGIGELEFAFEVARALLCEAPRETARPCGACAACHWFEQGNHPDFLAVFPENMAARFAELGVAAEAPAEAAGDRGDAGAKGEGGKSRAPSREIKIDQVRALLEFAGVGAHRGGKRVVLLAPAERLNPSAANALLKTLEEPPPGLAFLLVSSRPERLLPTILSRCRRWPLPLPDTGLALSWLEQQGVARPAEALALAGGAPCTARDAADDAYAALRLGALEQLARAAQCDPMQAGEALQKVPLPLVIGWLQRWGYDLMAGRFGGGVRYFPEQRRVLAHCAATLEPVELARFMRELGAQRGVEDHPLNPRLVVESLFLRYRGLFAAPPAAS